MNSRKDLLPQKPDDIPYFFVEYWNRGDAWGIASLFAEDAEFVNVVGLWWHDRQAIYKAHDYGLKVIFPDSSLDIRKTTLKMLSDDIAVVHTRLSLSNQSGKAGIRKPGRRQNIFTFVMKKFDEGWICVAAHNTDIVPGKETNIIDDAGNITAIDYRK